MVGSASCTGNVMIRHIQRVSVILLALVAATAAPAQERAPLSFDLGLGVSDGVDGGLRHMRSGFAGSALVAWRWRHTMAGQPLLALAGSGRTSTMGYESADCLITPAGGCASNYPSFQSVALLAGCELSRGPRGASARLLLGPAAFHSAEDASALGALGRIDLATPALLHVALVVWGETGVVPRLRGERYRMNAIGLGMRVR